MNCNMESKDFGKVHHYTANIPERKGGINFRVWLSNFLRKHKSKWNEESCMEVKNQMEKKELEGVISYEGGNFKVCTHSALERMGEKDHNHHDLVDRICELVGWNRGCKQWTETQEEFKIQKKDSAYIRRAIDESHFSLPQDIAKEIPTQQIHWFKVTKPVEADAEDLTEEIPGDLRFLFERVENKGQKRKTEEQTSGSPQKKQER
eukprot:TRINITY_DN3930_c0_g1_i2.p1 TRINITY_DN3930_c0_g1~~TRINITY_DN3930_c0_g1_i2.p1  ORF type:complete len:206 (+),score=79.13 TRINITY_DN3930_c0_g1_i2:179-796(+)